MSCELCRTTDAPGYPVRSGDCPACDEADEWEDDDDAEVDRFLDERKDERVNDD